jgi:hypothetical protein
MKKATSKKASIELSKEQMRSCKRSSKAVAKVEKQASKAVVLASQASTQTDMQALRDYWCALSIAAAEECQRLTDELNLMP